MVQKYNVHTCTIHYKDVGYFANKHTNRQNVCTFFYQDKSYQFDDMVGCGKSHLKFLLNIHLLHCMQTRVLDLSFQGCQEEFLTGQFPLLSPDHCKFSFNLSSYMYIALLVGFLTQDLSGYNTG